MFSKVTSVFDHFKKPADPKDLVRKWQSELRSEQRGMERQIRDLAREEKLAQKNVRMILTFFLLFHMLPSLDLAERREKIKKTNLFFYPLPPPPLPPHSKKNRSATPPSAATPPAPRPSPARSSAAAPRPRGSTCTRRGSST